MGDVVGKPGRARRAHAPAQAHRPPRGRPGGGQRRELGGRRRRLGGDAPRRCSRPRWTSSPPATTSGPSGRSSPTWRRTRTGCSARPTTRGRARARAHRGRDAGRPEARGGQPRGPGLHEEPRRPVPRRPSGWSAELRSETPCILVDMHCEATSEKNAMGAYLDGKVSAVVGTHTHVQTADERMLPGRHGLHHRRGHVRPAGLGHRREEGAVASSASSPSARPVRGGQEPTSTCRASCVDIDDATGKARSIERVREHRDGAVRLA